MCPKPVHISFMKKALLALFLFVSLGFGLVGGFVAVLGVFVCLFLIFCCWLHLFDLLLDKTSGRDTSKIWPTESIQPFCTEERFSNKFH